MNKKNIEIGLLGFEFKSPNKGCEALTYSFIYMLKEIFQEYKIKIYNFANCPNMGEVPENFPDIIFEEVPMRRRNVFHINERKKIRRCAFVFDVTMGDSFSDIYSKKACKYLISQKKLIANNTEKYVLLPQTYGPFSDASILKNAMGVIERARLVLCRDNLSKIFLSKYLPEKKVDVLTDLAFFLPANRYEINKTNNKVKIGMNISGLLWKGGFTSDNQFGLKCDYKEYIYALLKEYTNNDLYQVYLIPHVIKDMDISADDDYNIIECLNKEFPNAIIAPRFQTPMDAKGYISEMDLFLGARMHSTIAAFSTGTAVIPFSYSRKFEGLYDDYDYKFLIDGKELQTELAIEKTKEYIDCYLDIKKEVEEKQELIYREKQKLLDYVRNIFSE